LTLSLLLIPLAESYQNLPMLHGVIQKDKSGTFFIETRLVLLLLY